MTAGPRKLVLVIKRWIVLAVKLKGSHVLLLMCFVMLSTRESVFDTGELQTVPQQTHP